MQRPLVIIHANCQGEPLEPFLSRVPQLAGHDIRLYTNYVREPLGRAELERCEFFLYQYLTPDWGDLATERLLERLPADCRTLSFPSMFLQAYWPFWKRVGAMDKDRDQAMEYPDSLLDRLLDEGLPPAEAVRLYCRGGLVRAADLDGIWQASLERERVKESRTPIQYVDWMLARYQKEMIFNTANHPGHAALCFLGRRMLEELGLDEPEGGVEAAMPELYPEFRLPVHPQVAEHFGLAFAGPDARYPVYGRDLTFAQYALEYALARAEGITEFIAFLRVRGGQWTGSSEDGA